MWSRLVDYKSTTALNGHVMKYQKGRFRYECSVCGKGYMVSESLKRHLKEHSGEKVFKNVLVMIVNPILVLRKVGGM